MYNIGPRLTIELSPFQTRHTVAPGPARSAASMSRLCGTTRPWCL
ncbi:uncharacterized protein CTRU02_206883 [Colletotrichum truncatum]|uniref:Uncharacterized protein n=1 Tax=Colletotrichum truncatum TaxID=5467 RepID=A0ACC3YZ31_COLTU|nr:uncharacterized protein CTRU02_15378 [Colletotrichum truncatum]KAF6781098.1 hypothetical protein CTRU02_15378 [Colletotrichum truncatum]